MIIGIDLGTTYSAVAIPEERTGDGFFTFPGCPGYSVVLDPLERRISPSVIAEDENGEIITGYLAKARAGFSPEPIMFAKRSMGEDVTFRLDKQGALRPEEVSAHILRYLKRVAEERLGESVTEAVITVPAYFSLRAKQMTEKAGEMAGLRVMQIAQEPVAAALMYCAGDQRDPLTILTYDLGGGTFDIAILEKKDGTISTNSILAFDGDRFLGGYDFDKALAMWMIDRLKTKGYDLDPSDRIAFAKLMVYAEHAKRKLSEEESYEFYEHQTGITDRKGKPVVIELGVTRKQFEEMIRKDVEKTVDLCRRAMTKADRPLTPDKIDEIIMVGGSSRIPLVKRLLEAEFGKKPKLIEPDLCVALGAAILAATKGTTFGCLRLDPIPKETDLETLTVTGRLIPTEQLKTIERGAVTLRALDGSYLKSRATNSEGAFLFDAVPLACEDTTEFVLSVVSGGAEVASHRFSVKQTATAKAGDIVQVVTNVLSKPISIQTVSGLRVWAPEKTPLPYETVVQAKTASTSGQIRVPILEENNTLGEIVMKGLPTTLPVGSSVEITLMIQENYQIRGRAYVASLAREEKVVIDIPIPAQKSLDELRRDFGILKARAEDALTSAGAGALFGGAKAKLLKDRLKECEEMLEGRMPEVAKIQDCLDEIENLTRNIGAGWKPDPPRAIFDQRVNEAQDLLAAVLRKKPKVAEYGYDKQVEAIRQEAEKAYTSQNTAVWKDSYERLIKLCDRLESLRDEGGSSAPADPGALLMALARELASLEDWTRHNNRYLEFEADFKHLAATLKQIDPMARDAMMQIRDWYFTKYLELKKRLGAEKSTDFVEIL